MATSNTDRHVWKGTMIFQGDKVMLPNGEEGVVQTISGTSATVILSEDGSPREVHWQDLKPAQ